MKEKQILALFDTAPVLTTKQLAAAIGDMNYTKVSLSKLVARGTVTRLRRGIYTIHEDPVIYASHIFHPSYISLWFAFQHHGATTQLPRRIEVMARRNEALKNVDLIKTKELWGYRQVNYRGQRIFMADLEKAIIDAIETERMPVDEVMNAIGKADLEKLVEYALRMPVTVMKKIGYVAEMAGHPLEVLFKRVKDDRNYAIYYAAENGNRWRVKK